MSAKPLTSLQTSHDNKLCWVEFNVAYCAYGLYSMWPIVPTNHINCDLLCPQIVFNMAHYAHKSYSMWPIIPTSHIQHDLLYSWVVFNIAQLCPRVLFKATILNWILSLLYGMSNPRVTHITQFYKSSRDGPC